MIEEYDLTHTHPNFRLLALRTTGCGSRLCILSSVANGLTSTVDQCGELKVLSKMGHMSALDQLQHQD